MSTLGQVDSQGMLDPNMYVKIQNDRIIIIVLYIDDRIVTFNNTNWSEDMKVNLEKTFEMVDSRDLHCFLCMEIR